VDDPAAIAVAGMLATYAAAALVSVFTTASMADSASALVGMRWGTRKWFHNPGKSYAGTIAGTVVAGAAALVLVGPLGALLCMGVFLATDVAAPIPVPVTDNLLNPVILAAAYWVWAPQPVLPYY
jgi:dolichol kinase